MGRKPTRKMDNKVYIELYESDKPDKKYMVLFKRNKEEFKRVHFGAKGMEDYTTHGDEKRKENYLARHKKNENWYDPYTAGSLAKWLLWNKPTLRSSWNDYKKRFKFK